MFRLLDLSCEDILEGMFSTNNSTLNYMIDYDHKSSSEDFDPLMDDYEAAELGKCKEVISDEMYMPCHKSRDWVRCFIATCSQPDCYRYMVIFN